MYDTIVVGITNHDTALAAAEHARNLARSTGGRIHLVYAIAPGEGQAAETARRHADGLLQAMAVSPQVAEVHVETDRPDAAMSVSPNESRPTSS